MLSWVPIALLLGLLLVVRAKHRVAALVVLGRVFMVSCLWSSCRPERVDEDLTGVVRDPGGAVVPHARVGLVYTCDSCGRHDRQVEVDCDGRGEFRVLRPVADHPALITAFAPGLASVPIEFLTSAVPPEVHELHLVPEAGITGTLLDGDGSPMGLRGIEVWSPALIDADEGVTTDLSGRFEIAGLPPGRTRLTVWPTEAEMAQKGWEESYSLEQALTRALFVHLSPGQVVEAHIPPAPEQLVSVQARVTGLSGYELSATRVDNDALENHGDLELHGGFSYRFLLGPGLHHFTVSLMEQHLIQWRTQVDVPDAPSFDFEWAITFGDLHGIVRRPDGSLVPGAEIFWVQDNGLGGAPSWLVSVTAADGAFEVRRLPAGPQMVCARSGERLSPWTKVQVVDERATDVELVLEQ